jgi:hypothetical protein
MDPVPESVHADAAAKEHGMWLLYESITQTQHNIFYEATTSPINYLFRPGMSILHCINVQASHIIITYFLCFIKLRLLSTRQYYELHLILIAFCLLGPNYC